MWRQTMRHAMAILLGIPLAVVGGVLGNVVFEQLPSEVSAPLQRARCPPRPRGHHPGSSRGDAASGSGAGRAGDARHPRVRSRWRQRAAVVLVVMYEVFWAAGSLVEIFAAGSLANACFPFLKSGY
jgi:hypothetical protein